MGSRFVQTLLAILARAILRRTHPLVIGVTGSVGKSTSKEAIALVVAKQYQVRVSAGNMNNEFGLPLTIIGAVSPGRSLGGWVKVFFKGLGVLLFPRQYPEALVLEMGIDRPGDMDRHLEIIGTPHIGVLTHVSGSHLEFFGSVATIGKEKGKLFMALAEDGFAIVNADNKEALKEVARTRAKVITYGFDDAAQVRAEHLRLVQERGVVEGVSFKLNYVGKNVPVRLPGVFGRHQVNTILSSVAVGIALKMNLVDIADALLNFRPVPGRLQVLAGKAGTMLVEDSYNASVASVQAALGTVREIIAPRKVVILGDMLELGATKIDDHRALAPIVLGSGASVFVGVGRYMTHLAAALHGTGFPEKHIYHYPDVEAALRSLSQVVRNGDVVLVKGSQGMRMEKISEALLNDSVDPTLVLPRQTALWRSTPFTPPAEWER